MVDRIVPVPPGKLAAFAPATHYLYEWTDYWLEHPRADRVKVGDGWAPRLRPGLFRVRFD